MAPTNMQEDASTNMQHIEVSDFQAKLDLFRNPAHGSNENLGVNEATEARKRTFQMAKAQKMENEMPETAALARQAPRNLPVIDTPVAEVAMTGLSGMGINASTVGGKSTNEVAANETVVSPIARKDKKDLERSSSKKGKEAKESKKKDEKLKASKTIKFNEDGAEGEGKDGKPVLNKSKSKKEKSDDKEKAALKKSKSKKEGEKDVLKKSGSKELDKKPKDGEKDVVKKSGSKELDKKPKDGDDEKDKKKGEKDALKKSKSKKETDKADVLKSSKSKREKLEKSVTKRESDVLLSNSEDISEDVLGRGASNSRSPQSKDTLKASKQLAATYNSKSMKDKPEAELDGPQKSRSVFSQLKSMKSSKHDGDDEESDDDGDNPGLMSESAWVEGNIYKLQINLDEGTADDNPVPSPIPKGTSSSLVSFAFVSVGSGAVLIMLPDGQVDIAEDGRGFPGLAKAEKSNVPAVNSVIKLNAEDHGISGTVLVGHYPQVDKSHILRPIFAFIPSSYPEECLMATFTGYHGHPICVAQVKEYFTKLKEGAAQLKADHGVTYAPKFISLFDTEEGHLKDLGDFDYINHPLTNDHLENLLCRPWANVAAYKTTRRLNTDWFTPWYDYYAEHFDDPVQITRVASTPITGNAKEKDMKQRRKVARAALKRKETARGWVPPTKKKLDEI